MVTDPWQMELVYRAALRIPWAWSKVYIWSIADGNPAEVQLYPRSHGGLYQPAKRRDVGGWPWAKDSLWAQNGSQAKGKVLAALAQWPDMTTKMGRQALGEGDAGRSAQRCFTKLLELRLAQRREEKGRYRYFLKDRGYALLTRRDGVPSRTAESKRDDPDKREDLKMMRKAHEDGLMSIMGQFMAAGLPVAEGSRSWETMFYDGQGFMVRKNSGVTRALQLRDATVCVTQGTTTELNLQDFSTQYNLDIRPLTFEDTDAVSAAYQAGQCDAFTNDRSQLAVIGSGFDDPSVHTILPETISEEPTGPVVPHGDDQWFDIVKTVMAILIYGEAYGISQGSVPSTATGTTVVDRLLGTEGSFEQESLGLSKTVGQTVLRDVGNYGEIYARNLGPGGINLPREGSRNALWADAPCRDCPKGGQIYAAPLR